MIQWYVRSAMTQVFEMCGCAILSEWNFHALTRVYIRNFDKLFYRLKWKCHFNWYWPHTHSQHLIPYNTFIVQNSLMENWQIRKRINLTDSRDTQIAILVIFGKRKNTYNRTATNFVLCFVLIFIWKFHLEFSLINKTNENRCNCIEVCVTWIWTSMTIHSTPSLSSSSNLFSLFSITHRS